MKRVNLVLATVCALFLSFACVTTFDIDAGELPDAGSDGGVVADAGTSDAVVSGDAASGVDTRSSNDAASGVDHNGGGSDAASGLDSGGGGSDAASASDGAGPRDATSSSSDGGVEVGGHCETVPCVDTATCVGNSTEAFCRTKCTQGAGDCNAQSEYCISLTLPDGGTAATGACVPAQGEGALCSSEPCAEVYICAYYGDAAARSCRTRCLPQSPDSGCPAGQNCLGFTGQDAGACL